MRLSPHLLCASLAVMIAACVPLPAGVPAPDRDARLELASRIALFVERVDRSRYEGLDPSSYGTKRLLELGARLISEENEVVLAEAKRELALHFFRFSRHLAHGRIEPEEVRPGWRRAGRDYLEVEALFEGFISGSEPRDTLESIAPPHEAYERLAGLLRSYHESLEEAPSRHIEERIRTIEANLERWRWMPRVLEGRYLEVNIPAYTLTFRDNESAEEMRAIVGRYDTPTPVFRSAINQVVINPAWHVPRSIVEKEIVPELRKDRSYLSKHHMEIRDGDGEPLDPGAIQWEIVGAGDLELRVRQLPGAWNALGQIKFNFPNPEDVYMHGTPAGSLFEKPVRALSHGCIRIEHPMAIARRILSDTPLSLDAAVRSGETKYLPLGDPLPIYLSYWTAWVDENGSANFVPDIYGVDSKISEMLRKRP